MRKPRPREPRSLAQGRTVVSAIAGIPTQEAPVSPLHPPDLFSRNANCLCLPAHIHSGLLGGSLEAMAVTLLWEGSAIQAAEAFSPPPTPQHPLPSRFCPPGSYGPARSVCPEQPVELGGGAPQAEQLAPAPRPGSPAVCAESSFISPALELVSPASQGPAPG